MFWFQVCWSAKKRKKKKCLRLVILVFSDPLQLNSGWDQNSLCQMEGKCSKDDCKHKIEALFFSLFFFCLGKVWRGPVSLDAQNSKSIICTLKSNVYDTKVWVCSVEMFCLVYWNLLMSLQIHLQVLMQQKSERLTWWKATFSDKITYKVNQ